MNEEIAYYFEQLKDMFPEKTSTQIQDIIVMVLESEGMSSVEEKFEMMVNMLIEHDCPNEAGPSGSNASFQHEIPSEIYHHIIQVFPNVSIPYLEELCKSKSNDLDDIIDDLSLCGYETVPRDPIDIYTKLKQLLPQADPTYLQEKAQDLARKSEDALNAFIDNAIISDDYPTIQVYLKNKKEEDELSLYTTNFNVDKYLEQFPDPFKHFSDSTRTNPIQNADDENYALNYLFNHYRFVRTKNIQTIFYGLNRTLTDTCNRLDRFPKNFREPRPPTHHLGNTRNKALLQEIAFLQHRKEIRYVTKLKDEIYRQAREDAEKLNILETCQSCFNEELIPEECYFCRKDCVFCKDCIIQGTEVAISSGELVFPCFANCDSHFSLRTLQRVLDREKFELITQKIQYDELKRANIEGLEYCPFCDYVALLSDTESVFKCKNIDCMKETCRKCRHEAHIPKRCNEIEYDEDVQRRTYIENKMSEALIRKCYKCQKPYIKEGGCNKITCKSCGAFMCYLCDQPITGYEHFERAPTWCKTHSNWIASDQMRVVNGAKKAKQDLGDVEIKFDPTIGLPEI